MKHVFETAFQMVLTFTVCSNVIIFANARVAVWNVNACGSVVAWTYLARIQC